ncbi:hypothetical protein CRM73_00160 [Kocuria sp. CCUG 69068]|uniref:hypothetical protein n=1 Tax=Kocuria sp. CCUG 69068 TaxID=2043138 RepID=UPI001E336DC3|nr:hypothetical protein [Kocuria sp. CCUG 69068]
MKVTATVVLRRPSDSELVVLTAGQELPEWATDMVTHPGLLAGSAPAEPEVPPAPDDKTTEPEAPPADPETTEDEPPVIDEVDGDELATGPEVETRQDDAPAETGTVSGETPSGEWTLRRLREYAQAHGVDLGEARSKADVLDALSK